MRSNITLTKPKYNLNLRMPIDHDFKKNIRSIKPVRPNGEDSR